MTTETLPIQANGIDELAAYIPMDRRQALSAGENLPLRLHGAGLFADISGFTPLTEALTKEFGPLRGAEELTIYLNLVYDSLIDILHRYGGSVIGFSGDAITCWFNEDNGQRAVSCGLAMQEEMVKQSSITISHDTTVSLTIKVAISTGTVQRFVVGDPDIRFIDVISGRVLDNLAATEHMAEKEEVLLDENTAASVGNFVQYLEWRTDPESGAKYGLVKATNYQLQETPWPIIQSGAITKDQMKSWVLNPVFSRLEAGQGEFLAELRPAIALFMRFQGIDFESDGEAENKLNEFVTKIQRILKRFEGTLIQLTIGDKGSYLYAAFGAPVAHEDDAIRAASVALELQSLANQLDYISSIQIGITRGRMRTGAYGGNQRRTYGVLGDAVNLAARLMQAARPNEILVERMVEEIISERFNFDPLPEIRVKGKSGTIQANCLVCEKKTRTFQIYDHKFLTPLVGRKKELALIENKLARTSSGSGQVIGIVAEAGMGKSRLAAEIMQEADRQGFQIYGGECVSFGTNTSYLVWQAIWRAIFNINTEWTTDEQVAKLHNDLERIDPTLIPRLPLLGIVLNIPIPDNTLTSSMDAKLRKSSLESLLLQCLREKVQEKPALIILEDSHWIDPISQDLLLFLSRPSINMKLITLVVYRPQDVSNLSAKSLQNFPNFTEIELEEFSPDHARELLLHRFDQLFDASTRIPESLIEKIINRAQGNPFYIEELLNYFRHQGIDLYDSSEVERADLPASLHSLILSRIDQLEENRKTTLKIASVIGRNFKKPMLSQIHTSVGKNGKLDKHLQDLSAHEFIDLDIEFEQQYIFKHIVTQEVSYKSLPYARRASIHEQIGVYLEETHRDNISPFVGLLAYHYENSFNDSKKRIYLLLAAQEAEKNYSNNAAIDYFERLVPLLPTNEQAEVRMQLGKVYERVGKWQEANNEYHQVLKLTITHQDEDKMAWCQTAISELHRRQGQYEEAKTWLGLAQDSFREQNNLSGLGQTYHNGGTLAAQQGNFDEALELYSNSLEIREKLDDKANIGSLLSNMGIIAGYRNELQKSYDLYKESLDIRRQTEDKYAIAVSLNNLGNAARKLGKIDEARKRLEEAVGYQMEVGDQWGIGNALNNLANCSRSQGLYIEACDLYRQSLTIYRDLGDKWALAYLLEDIGSLRIILDEHYLALQLIAAAASLRQEIGSPLPPVEQEKIEDLLVKSRAALSSEEQKEAWDHGSVMPLDQAIELAMQDICI